MAGQPNIDQFEAYFRRADLDGDGRISGNEAVSFFQGANLPKQTLAQIWMHADQSHTGFLSRQEFYNALKLVTVGQSKRELTPEIVKAALYGPASAKIPPPKINVPATPVQQLNPTTASSPLQMGKLGPAVQNLGLRGPGIPNASMNQQYFPSPQTQTARPPPAVSSGIAPRPAQGMISPDFSRGSSMMGHLPVMPTGTAPHPPQSMPASTASPTIPTSSISTDWLGGKSSAALSVSPTTSNVTAQLQAQFPVPSQPSVTDSKALVVSGNGFATGSPSGDDLFSAISTIRKQEPLTPHPSSGQPASATTTPAKSGGLSVKSNSLDSLQSAYSMQPLGGQLQRTQSLPTSGQQASTPVSSSVASPSFSVGVGNPSDSNSQPPWPKMKPSDVQKYAKVFMEVDTDRDGRITGEQARNLFLSWRLPREVLKQVWDLSDQDNDSMLSLREFCFALYLMERYREGRTLPASLPSIITFDETLLSMTGQPKGTYGNTAWNPGFGQQPGMGARPMAPAAGLRPPVPVTPMYSQPDNLMAANQQKPRAPVLEDSFLNQSNSGEQNFMPQDGSALEKKVAEPEKLILDSKEKIEFYRNKMQDLVLYKSRCDNRLNEITERALADKREAEMLGKKYEEKYKQVAEVASKLTIEEATFRDVQERKFELNQAIVNMEQGGSADGILQVRADRLQSDLDELMRVLIERCKKHGVEFKSAALIELPYGWQPGIHEGAAVWDEDWDKFEDEGFANDLTVNGQHVSGSNSKSTVQKDIGSQDGSLTPDSISNDDGKSANIFSSNEHAVESESAYAHSEDELARSPHGSSTGRTALESPSRDFSDVFAKSIDADAETHRSFDESTWGAFDAHDETDSVWGFNPADTKDSDTDKHRDFFGTGDFDVKPIRTGSPSADSFFQKKSPFFEDSVAGSPVSRFGNSPRYSEAGDHMDSFSRMESFDMHGSGISPREGFTRYDSVSSSKEFGHSRAFSSFDDADPFGSSGPFKVSSDNQTSKRSSENWGGF